MTILMFAAGLLAVMLRFRPARPSQMLYTPRTFQRPGAEALHADLAATAAVAPLDFDDPKEHIPMTTGEFRRIVVEARDDTAAQLDLIEAEFRAGLEWLEAAVMVWLDEDPEVVHADVVVAEYLPPPPPVVVEPFRNRAARRLYARQMRRGRVAAVAR